ncbi:MAG: YbgC/FadM family acyl-CoA thioesterase [Pseudomonadales bacterium]|nr:YbgC/FadM family acyl-CoA thioesterase [Pseudomonadales bacterium]
MTEFITKLRVYIEDTDFGGVVYHANYLRWIERARTELLRASGFEQKVLMDQDLLFMIRGLDIRYRASAKLDDEVIIKTAISELRSASMVFSQKVFLAGSGNSVGALLCEANVQVASVSVASRKVIAVPKMITAALVPYQL